MVDLPGFIPSLGLPRRLKATLGDVFLLALAGFLACYIIKELLGRGYTVRGTVRDASDAKKTAHILQLVSHLMKFKPLLPPRWPLFAT